MSLKLNSSGGGSVTLQEPVTASTRTLTLPDNDGTVISTASTGVITQAMIASNVAGTGPAFSAYQSTTQSVTGGVFFKMVLQTEDFDFGSCFDNTTNYRFQPNIAGLYQVSASVTRNSNNCDMSVNIYKNGSIFSYGNTGYGTIGTAQVSRLIYMNGTTDYLEFYGYFSISQNTNATSFGTWATAFLARTV